MKSKSLFVVALSTLLFISSVKARGKTYDDLDDILKKDGLNSMKTHVVYQAPFDEGIHIDPNKVVHVKQYQP